MAERGLLAARYHEVRLVNRAEPSALRQQSFHAKISRFLREH
jgi:hypothetical protein